MGNLGNGGVLVLVVTVGLGLGASSRARATETDVAAAGVRNRIECPMTRPMLDRAAEGALRRLQSPECGRIFSDFKDRAGRTLAGRLEAMDETGAGYLARRMWFVDGSGARACQDSSTVFVTQPGSAVVFVRTRQLRTLALHDPVVVESLLIHEQLHSLGLGENPPSTHEITSQVQRRCGTR